MSSTGENHEPETPPTGPSTRPSGQDAHDLPPAGVAPAPYPGAPGAVPASSAGTPPRDGARLTRWGKILVRVGVLALPGTVLLGVVVYRGFSSDVEALENSPTSEVRSLTPVQLAEGEKRRIWITEEISGNPGCVVRDAAGAETTVTRGNSTSSLENGDRGYYSVGEFTAPTSGTYEFGCYHAESVLAPSEAGSGVVGSVAGIFGAFGLGGLGALSLIAGVILWAVGASRTRSAGAGPDPAGRGQNPFGPVSTTGAAGPNPFGPGQAPGGPGWSTGAAGSPAPGAPAP